MPNDYKLRDIAIIIVGLGAILLIVAAGLRHEQSRAADAFLTSAAVSLATGAILLTAYYRRWVVARATEGDAR